MANKTFKNMKELEKHINKVMKDVLQNEVAEKVRDVQQDKIEEVVYDAYSTPTVDRRGERGGLSDRNNMIAEILEVGGGLQLNIKNITDGNPDVDYTTFTQTPNYLAGIIEYGREPNRKGLYTYNRYGTEGDFLQPRPFTQETVEHLERTDEHVNAMKKGLKRNDINVK